MEILSSLAKMVEDTLKFSPVATSRQVSKVGHFVLLLQFLGYRRNNQMLVPSKLDAFAMS